jgi:hypothetical protein
MTVSAGAFSSPCRGKIDSAHVYDLGISAVGGAGPAVQIAKEERLPFDRQGRADYRVCGCAVERHVRSVDIEELGKYALRSEQRYASELQPSDSGGSRCAGLAAGREPLLYHGWLNRPIVSRTVSTNVGGPFPISLVAALFRVIGSCAAEMYPARYGNTVKSVHWPTAAAPLPPFRCAAVTCRS